MYFRKSSLVLFVVRDMSTGEVVHTDLGITFDQGKVLPIAECIPFQLTADMADGFGMSGTEGVFRRCAEEALSVLRDGSDIMKTVLEVFRYDPLHSWMASAVRSRGLRAIPHLLSPNRIGQARHRHRHE